MGWVCLLLGTKHVEAQSFILTLTNTPSPVTVGTNLTYSLSVSNATGFNLNPGLITSEYGSNAEFVALSRNVSGAFIGWR